MSFEKIAFGIAAAATILAGIMAISLALAGTP